MDEHIDYQSIRNSFGCDNCKHEDDGLWDDYCRVCNPDCIPPSKYRPVQRSIQEKLYYNEVDRISYSDYLRYLRIGK